jgi:hypothetical protein
MDFVDTIPAAGIASAEETMAWLEKNGMKNTISALNQEEELKQKAEVQKEKDSDIVRAGWRAGKPPEKPLTEEELAQCVAEETEADWVHQIKVRDRLAQDQRFDHPAGAPSCKPAAARADKPKKKLGIDYDRWSDGTWEDYLRENDIEPDVTSVVPKKTEQDRLNDTIWEDDAEGLATRLAAGGEVDWSARRAITYPPLHYSARYGRAAMIRVLVGARGCSAEVLDEVDLTGWTPLQWASCYGFTEVAELLLQAGADANIADSDKLTALHRAVANDRFELAKLLVKHGAVRTGLEVAWAKARKQDDEFVAWLEGTSIAMEPQWPQPEVPPENTHLFIPGNMLALPAKYNQPTKPLPPKTEEETKWKYAKDMTPYMMPDQVPGQLRLD